MHLDQAGFLRSASQLETCNYKPAEHIRIWCILLPSWPLGTFSTSFKAWIYVPFVVDRSSLSKKLQPHFMHLRKLFKFMY